MNDPLEGQVPFTSFADIERFVDNNATHGMVLKWHILTERYFTKEELAADWKDTGTVCSVHSGHLLRDGMPTRTLTLILSSRSRVKPLEFILIYDVPLSDRRP